ncbi:hypothetical protein H0H93_010815 [Arthromyces matolae]|nr:hypothetical protein H0H93_010815 [Arthromyces matolae]
MLEDRTNEVTTSPPPSNDPAFSQLFVGDKGITVTFLPEIEGKEGPVLPTEEWLERDILRGLHGWIDVHQDCLSGNAVAEAVSSAEFSSTFNLLILPTQSPSTTPEPIFQRPPSRSSTPSPAPIPQEFFANVPPVFLPPPFTPSHPVFSYLADYAVKESQSIRNAAQEHMTEQMKLKTSEIERADMELRRKVNSLWKRIREGINHIQGETGRPSVRRASASGSRERSTINGLEQTGMPGSVIRSFVPVSVSRQRSSSPPGLRMSALSASLATSSFHHPRATASSPPPRQNHDSSQMSNGTSHSDSTGASSVAIPGSVNNVRDVRRNMSERMDMATSYKYFRILEEDTQRMRGRPLSKKDDEPDRSEMTDSSLAPVVKDADKGATATLATSPPSPTGADKKGKRKVTFDIKPAVVTIKREVTAEQIEEDRNAAREESAMIFELEDVEKADQGSPGNATLQLVEQPAAAIRPRRQRPQNTDTLSASFIGLRPTSLPTPSHVRPSRVIHGVSNSTMALSVPKPSPLPASDGTDSSATAATSNAQSGGAHETLPPDPEILKLVAADTPSHRGAWNSDSKAWRTFVNRQPGPPDNAAILEEGEDEKGTDASGFAIPDMLPKHLHQSEAISGSLPLSIKLPKKPEELSLASYQPTALTTQISTAQLPTSKKRSSSAMRMAVYAERDRSRTLDPGPLDFATAPDDDEGEDEEAEGPSGSGTTELSAEGERSRRAAFKILKARSEIPDSGMWRSLA